MRDTKTIIVFGRPRYQKCNIISAVLQDNYCSKLPSAAQKDRPRRSSKDIKGTMIHSQYEIHDPQSGISTVVTEHTAKEIALCAAPNLKYFPVFKDEFPERIMDPWMEYDRLYNSMKYCRIYERLSTFTTKTLRNTGYSTVRNQDLLYPAFIRRYQNEENILIPSDIVRLIGAYFECAAPLMNLFRIQEPNGDIFNFCETSCSITSRAHWSQMALSHRVDGFIFMVDLMWYNEYFVDENGQRINRLERTVSVWNKRINKHNPFSIMIVTNLESFMRKTKVVPPTVCPLFCGLDDSETINWTEWCLERICQKHVDVYDQAVGGWFGGRIKEFGSDDNGHRGEVKVHYDGYHSIYDEWMPVDSDFLAPLNLYSRRYGSCNWFQTVNAMPSLKKLTWDTYLC